VNNNSSSSSSSQTSSNSNTIMGSGKQGPILGDLINKDMKSNSNDPKTSQPDYREEASIAKEVIDNVSKYAKEEDVKMDEESLIALVKKIPAEIMREFLQLARDPRKDIKLQDPTKKKSIFMSKTHKESMEYLSKLTGNPITAKKVEEAIFKAIQKKTQRLNPLKAVYIDPKLFEDIGKCVGPDCDVGKRISIDGDSAKGSTPQKITRKLIAKPDMVFFTNRMVGSPESVKRYNMEKLLKKQIMEEKEKGKKEKGLIATK